MAQRITLPMLGNSMEEGTIVQWFKAEGDAIKKGDPLLEVMSDKANFEVESEAEGVVRKILVAADETVPVGTGIVIIGAADENIDELLTGGATAVAAPVPAQAAASAQLPAPSVSAAMPASVVDAAQLAISPRAMRLAAEKGVPVAALAGRGTGPGGRVIERDVVAYAATQQGVEAARVTPLAARIADDLGVDVAGLASGLPGSKITAEVVRTAAVPKEAPSATAPPTPAGEVAVSKVIPFRGMRKMVADTVTRSRQTAPHITVTMEVDMSQAVALQPQLAAQVMKVYNTKLTYTDVLVRATALSLGEHPLCNAALVCEEIRLYEDRNVGVAVATETGLVVPVIRQAERKTLGELSIELKALVERCRTGKQTQDDLSGGTFTITNLGAFGVDNFDPILVPPQSCILGVCRIAQKPIAVDGQVVVHPTMNLCLSIDHRVLDGVPAARFLQTLKGYMENPLSMFV